MNPEEFIDYLSKVSKVLEDSLNEPNSNAYYKGYLKGQCDALNLVKEVFGLFSMNKSEVSNDDSEQI